MPTMSLTSLRAQLYKVVDGVIATGIPVEIERNGHKVKIILEQPKSKLANLQPHNCIVGDAEDLVSLPIDEWQGGTDL